MKRPVPLSCENPIAYLRAGYRRHSGKGMIKWTVREIARATGCTERTIINLEKMNSRPAKDTCEALGYLIGWPAEAVAELWARKTGRKS